MKSGCSLHAPNDDWRQWKARGSKKQRVDYWNDVICQAVLDVDMTLPESTDDRLFIGNINSLNQVNARFVNFRSSSHGVTRTPKQVDRTDNKYLMVSLQCRGRSRLTQQRHEIVLNPGDIGIIDSGLPFQLYFPESVDRRIVMMPKPLLASRLRTVSNWKGPLCVKSDFVLTPVVVQLIRMLTEREGPIADAHAHLMLESMADYLAQSLSHEYGSSAEALNRTMFDSLTQYIAQNIVSPQLSATSVAAAIGVSVRTVHRLFKRFSDSSFEQYVIQRRLLLAKQSLVSGANTSVSDAAFAAGFNDLSHFTRRFSANFGIKPSSLIVRR